jgi:hypothetical protein
MIALTINEFIIYTGVILFLGQALGAVIQHLSVSWYKDKAAGKL